MRLLTGRREREQNPRTIPHTLVTAERGEQHAKGGRCTENRDVAKPPFGCVLFKVGGL